MKEAPFFELVSKYKGHYELLPQRETKYSAGYDLKAAEDVFILPDRNAGKPYLVSTGVKVKLKPNQVLLLVNRSSNSLKRYLDMPNGVGVIDADYYNNADNEGEIFMMISNKSFKSYQIHKGERIAQGIIVDYQTTSDDKASGKREGGLGSTDRKSK